MQSVEQQNGKQTKGGEKETKMCDDKESYNIYREIINKKQILKKLEGMKETIKTRQDEWTDKYLIQESYVRTK